jgi:hypothetical protein
MESENDEFIIKLSEGMLGQIISKDMKLLKNEIPDNW